METWGLSSFFCKLEAWRLLWRWRLGHGAHVAREGPCSGQVRFTLWCYTMWSKLKPNKECITFTGRLNIPASIAGHSYVSKVNSENGPKTYCKMLHLGMRLGCVGTVATRLACQRAVKATCWHETRHTFQLIQVQKKKIVDTIVASPGVLIEQNDKWYALGWHSCAAVSQQALEENVDRITGEYGDWSWQLTSGCNVHQVPKDHLSLKL